MGYIAMQERRIESGRTLVMLDMHGTSVNSDKQMLQIITRMVNENGSLNGGIVREERRNAAGEFIKYDEMDYDRCLGDLGIVKKDALEKNKAKIFEDILRKNGHENPVAEAARLFNEYDMAFGELLKQQIKEDFKKTPQERSIIPDGFITFVNQLKSEGIVLGFASNSGTKFLQDVLKEMGVIECFDPKAVIGSDIHKKDPTGMAIQKAVDVLNADSTKPSVAKVIFVGDAEDDRKCLEGFKSRNPDISADYKMMNLPRIELPSAPEAEGQASFKGFASLLVNITREIIQPSLRARL